MSEGEKESAKLSLLGEFWLFLKTRKRYWLVPLLILILLLAFFILFTESSALTPFIYNLF